MLATVNAGSLAEPGAGVDVAQARPGYLEYLHTGGAGAERGPRTTGRAIVDGLLGYRLPDGSAFNDVEAATQMLGVFIGGTETVPKIVGARTVGAVSPPRSVGRGARRSRHQRARSPARR